MKNTTVYWLTGLSGAGKSTIAAKFREKALKAGKSVRILDGDDIREKVHKHLDFTVQGITENNRLIAELCKTEVGRYDYILVSVISPFEAARQQSRKIVGDSYREVYIKASLDTVIQRDPKGLYKKALSGEINNFIGIADQVPYEVPAAPDLVLDTERDSVGQCVDILFQPEREPNAAAKKN
ncbi:MAG: adenylyl-sulfate kinase [Candidatus Omnitrophica bacterium]|nr:adenylyl-sulfate kinase [Candidatus Omnitrophota bacterium]